MPPKKNPKKRRFSRFFDGDTNMVRYTHEEIFGDRKPKIDMALKPKFGNMWTPQQRAALPDGLAQTAAPHLLINFLSGEVASEIPFIRSSICGLLYRNRHNLAEKETQLALVFIHQPAPGLLAELGYQPAKRSGVYYSKNPLFEDAVVVILHELSNALHNATMKLFARSQKARQAAYKTMIKHGADKMPSAMRNAIAQIAAMTEEDVDNFDEGMAASLYGSMGGMDSNEPNPLDDLSPDEITQIVEEHLRGR